MSGTPIPPISSVSTRIPSHATVKDGVLKMNGKSYRITVLVSGKKLNLDQEWHNLSPEMQRLTSEIFENLPQHPTVTQATLSKTTLNFKGVSVNGEVKAELSAELRHCYDKLAALLCNLYIPAVHTHADTRFDNTQSLEFTDSENHITDRGALHVLGGKIGTNMEAEHSGQTNVQEAVHSLSQGHFDSSLKTMISTLEANESIPAPKKERLLKQYRHCLDLEIKARHAMAAVIPNKNIILGELVTTIQANITALSEGEELLLPGGWGSPEGHQMLYKVTAEAGGTYTFAAINSGTGLSSFHHASDDGLSFDSAYERSGIDGAIMQDTETLTKLFKLYISHPPIDPNTNTQAKPAEYLYNTLIDNMGGTRTARNDNRLRHPQKGSTCTWESLKSHMKNSLSQNEYHAWKFTTRVKYLQQYFEENKHTLLHKPLRREMIESSLVSLSNKLRDRVSILNPQQKQEVCASLTKVHTLLVAIPRNLDSPARASVIMPVDFSVSKIPTHP